MASEKLELITTANYFWQKLELFDIVLPFGIPAQEIIQNKRLKPVEPSKFIVDANGTRVVNERGQFSSLYGMNDSKDDLTDRGYKEFDRDITRYDKDIRLYDEHASGLMTVLLNRLSAASKSTLATERGPAGYEAVKNSKDNLGLFRLLEKTHLGSQERAAQSAFQNWILFKMGDLSHEEYIKQLRALTDHVVSIFCDVEHPGYVKIDRITRAIYLMGVDQSFFSTQIDKALDDSSISADDLMARFQLYKIQHEHLLASSSTQYKGQALISDVPVKQTSYGPPGCLGTWNPVTNKSFCKFCWAKGYKKSDHTSKAEHDLKFPPRRPKSSEAISPAALVSAANSSNPLVPAISAPTIPVTSAGPLVASAKEFAKNFEDSMALYQSALRVSGQNVPPPALIGFNRDGNDSSYPSALCSIIDSVPSFHQLNFDELNQKLNQIDSLRDELIACLSTTESPEFIWDNAATVSITKSMSAFIEGSVSPIKEHIAIGGVSDGVVLTHTGLLSFLPSGFNRGFYSKESSVNLVSLGFWQDCGGSYHTQGKKNLIIKDDKGVTFDNAVKLSNRIYKVSSSVFKSSPSLLNSSKAFVSTPEFCSSCNPFSAYPSFEHVTAEQRLRCDRAEKLHCGRAAHRNDDDLCDALMSGAFHDTRVTAADVRLNRKLRGPCVDCILAKLKHKSMHPSDTQPAEAVADKLHMDIASRSVKSPGGKWVGIRMSDEFSGDIQNFSANSKSAVDLFQAIVVHLNRRYVRYGHRPRHIVADSEPSLLPVVDMLAKPGIEIILTFVDPGQHQQRIENIIGSQDALSRAVLSRLPYFLPQTYEPYLDAWVSHCCNGIPNSRSRPSCADIIVTGQRRTPHYDNPFLSFGDVVVCTMHDDKRSSQAKANGVSKNKVDRGEIGVVLGYSDNIPGDYEVLLSNNEIVPRRVLKVVNVIPFDWKRKKIHRSDLVPPSVYPDNPIADNSHVNLLPLPNNLSDSPTSIASLHQKFNKADEKGHIMAVPSDSSFQPGAPVSQPLIPSVSEPQRTHVLAPGSSGHIQWVPANSEPLPDQSSIPSTLEPQRTRILAPDANGRIHWVPVVPESPLPQKSISSLNEPRVPTPVTQEFPVSSSAPTSTSPLSSPILTSEITSRRSSRSNRLEPGFWSKSTSRANVACCECVSASNDFPSFTCPSCEWTQVSSCLSPSVLVASPADLKRAEFLERDDDCSFTEQPLPPLPSSLVSKPRPLPPLPFAAPLSSISKIRLDRPLSPSDSNLINEFLDAEILANSATFICPSDQVPLVLKCDEFLLDDAAAYYASLNPVAYYSRVSSADLKPVSSNKFKEMTLSKALNVFDYKKLVRSSAAEIAKQQSIGCLGTKVYTRPQLPSGSRIVPAVVVYKDKADGRETCRLTANSKVLKVDANTNTHASVSHEDDIMFVTSMMQAHCESRGESAEIRCFDISGAFLRIKRTSSDRLFLFIPENFPHPLAGLYLEIHGALYGLRESNRLFQLEVQRVLKAGSFTQSLTCPTTFYKHNDVDRGKLCIVSIHVDDFRPISNDPKLSSLLKNILIDRFVDVTESPVDQPARSFSGVDYTVLPNGAISTSQARHISHVASLIGVSHLPPVETPGFSDFFNSSTSESNCIPADQDRYMSLTGHLVQMLKTRDDVRPYISHLCSRNSKPDEGDFSKAIHVLRYLNSTPDVCRIFKSSVPEFCAHADAAFAIHENGRSSGAYFLSVGKNNAPFKTVAKMQQEVAPDPMAAEYYSANKATLDISYFRQFATELGWPPKGPTVLYLDCQTAINLVVAPEITKKSRHMRAKHHYIRELVIEGVVLVIHVPREEMRADFLTKFFRRNTFIALRDSLLNLSSASLSSKILSDSLVVLPPLTKKIEKNSPAVSGAPTQKKMKKFSHTKLCDHRGGPHRGDYSSIE